jgi:hypothetical protein
MKESAEAAMGRHKQIDWRRGWAVEQIEAEEERQFGAVFLTHPLEIDACDYSVVPSSFLPDAVRDGRRRCFVVLTCRWRQYKDFSAHWSVDGRPLLAFACHFQARHYVDQEQTNHGRLAIVEVETDDCPCVELFLIIDSGPYPQRSADHRAGKIVAAFSNHVEAEQDAVERERTAWRRACETTDRIRWAEWTSLPPTLIGDLCLDLGLPAPMSVANCWDLTAWVWWQCVAPLMDGWQRERLRLAMDRFSRYRVVAVPFSP